VTSDKVIRFVTALAVLTVAVIAAIVSYSHIEYLALVNGQTITAARLLPASVDGVVLVSSMVMLDAARRDAGAPGLSRVMLVAGVLATLGANSAVGAGHGVVGILVSGWPAVAFIGCAETFLTMVRGRSRTVPETALVTTAEKAGDTLLMSAIEAAPGGVPEVASSRTRPAAPRSLSTSGSRRRRGARTPQVVFAADLAAGTVPSIRAIRRECKVGQPRAVVIRDQLAAVVSAPRETIEATA
jgi:hypothetical protein